MSTCACGHGEGSHIAGRGMCFADIYQEAPRTICPCTEFEPPKGAKLPHTLLTVVLKIRAQEYAGSLYPGATVDARDRVYLAETGWEEFLDEALRERGLQLDGDVVIPGPYEQREETT